MFGFTVCNYVAQERSWEWKNKSCHLEFKKHHHEIYLTVKLKNSGWFSANKWKCVTSAGMWSQWWKRPIWSSSITSGNMLLSWTSCKDTATWIKSLLSGRVWCVQQGAFHKTTFWQTMLRRQILWSWNYYPGSGNLVQKENWLLHFGVTRTIAELISCIWKRKHWRIPQWIFDLFQFPFRSTMKQQT